MMTSVSDREDVFESLYCCKYVCMFSVPTNVHRVILDKISSGSPLPFSMLKF